VNIKGDVSPAYQLRRYAWRAKLPLSILTDFEEFAAYECRRCPQPKDRVSLGRATYIRYSDYVELSAIELAGTRDNLCRI